jgi:predicted PurR-regulated permease PerM
MAYSRRSEIVFAVAVALALLVAYRLREVLLIIYVSALFAVVIYPAVDYVHRLRIGRWSPGRGLSILLIILGGVGLITLFLIFALPPVFRDLQALAQDWPERASRINQRVKQWPVTRNFDVSALQQYAAGAVGGVLGVFRRLTEGLFGVFTWLILTAYFIIDGRRAFNWSMSLFPPERREKLRTTLVRAEDRVSRWLLGQALLMLILGSAATVTFALLGLKYYYALGVFAGLVNIVPIVGPLISFALTAVVAAFESWTTLLGVAIFYLAYQQVETAFLTPRVMKSTVDLPGLAVVIALALGGAFAGMVGALVAVPTAALLAVVIDEYVVHKDEPVESLTT